MLHCFLLNEKIGIIEQLEKGKKNMGYNEQVYNLYTENYWLQEKLILGTHCKQFLQLIIYIQSALIKILLFQHPFQSCSFLNYYIRKK